MSGARLALVALGLLMVLPMHSPPAAAAPAPILVQGQLVRLSGNQLPGPGLRPGAAAAAGRWVVAVRGSLAAGGQPLWRQPLPADRLLGRSRTDSQGRFALRLPPGIATLLIEVPQGYWLNRFDGQGDYATVTVQPGLPPQRLVDDRGALF